MDFINFLNNNELQVIELMSVALATTITGITIDSRERMKDMYNKKITEVLKTPKRGLVMPYPCNDHFEKHKYCDIICNFIDTITLNFSDYDLDNFYHNIHTLKINIHPQLARLLTFKAGGYDALKNNILLHFMVADFFYHEAFHMSSSINENGISFCGFEQLDLSTNDFIGRGLNESYTQILTQRYFGLKHNLYGRYEIPMHFTEILEHIVTEKKMGSLYLRADLFGLVDYLKQYSSEEEALSFIIAMDFIFTYFFTSGTTAKTMNENKLKEVNTFLI